MNYIGSCLGALVFNHARMGRLCDNTIDHLVASLERETHEHLGREMPFPTTWDPYFEAQMTLAALYAYPALPYAHHRRQLTVSSCPDAAPHKPSLDRRWPFCSRPTSLNIELIVIDEEDLPQARQMIGPRLESFTRREGAKLMW